MAYADYEYYAEEYGGTNINEEDFKFLSNRASVYIDAMTMRRARKATGDVLESVKMATCAIAEVFLDEENVNAAAYSEEALTASLSSESVGRWSKSYKTHSVSGTDVELMDKRKRDALLLYLNGTGLLRAEGYYVKGY